MQEFFENLQNKRILNIDYYSFNEAAASEFYNTLIQYHSTHYLYRTKENMRYYIRGLVAYDSFDLKYEFYQLALLAEHCDCIRFSGYGSSPERTDIAVE